MADWQGSESITQAEHISPNKTGDNIQAKRVAMYVWDGSEWGRMAQPGAAPDYAVAFDSDSTYDYFGFALPGTSTSSASWKVFRLSDDVKQYADGNANFDNQANNMPSLSYS